MKGTHAFVWKGEAKEVVLAGTFLMSWEDRILMEKQGNQWIYIATVVLVLSLEFGEEEVLL